MATIKDILANYRFVNTPADFKLYLTPLPEFQLKRGDGPTLQPGQSQTIREFSIPLSQTLQIEGSITRHDDVERFNLIHTRSTPKRFNLK